MSAPSLETVPPRPRFRPPVGLEPEPNRLQWVVVWSWDEPHRVGERISLPLPAAGGRWILGRGGGDESPGRLSLHRQRPGLHDVTGPLLAPGISREQLGVYVRRSGELEVENIGRCALRINGGPLARGEVHPGDLLELDEQLLLLCVLGRERLPALPDVPLHDFGGPDQHGIVGEGPAAWELRARIAFCAAQRAHVLVQGPSGTGKELVARALHALSPRRKRALVSRNAATLPEGLIDAELFGNARNYPNPGMAERGGLIGEADGSTLFLDEFGELPESAQAHLLRVMDQGEYQRLGESQLRRTDLRLIAATNRPESHLKHDVLARLKLRVAVPDLNERREDIPLVARHLLRQMARHNRHIAHRFFDGDPESFPRVSPSLMGALVRRSYALHVRELESLLWSAIAQSQGDFIDAPLELLAPAPAAQPDPPPLLAPSPPAAPRRPPPAVWEQGLDLQEMQVLGLCRRYRFNLAAASRDPSCLVERATLDLQLRVLLFRALAAAEWSLSHAAALIVGDGDAVLAERIEERMETTLTNLRTRLEEEGEAPLRERLSRQYRASFRWVEVVLAALRQGRLMEGRGRAPVGHPSDPYP